MNVLITGGNGFLGRAIIRRATREHRDWKITTMSRDESKMIRVKQRYPQVTTIKGDVSDDVDYLARLFLGQDVIIHAGANKLVDVGERSAFEVVKNNVIGSQHVALAAIKAGVGQVVGISSDKAVQPVNTYGMSKALMERIFQEADSLSDTQFVCARYGNVIGSTISIVLYFEEQLEKLGHILITDPAMTRFYMPVDQSIDVIDYAMIVAKRGSVVIPTMRSLSVERMAQLTLNESHFDAWNDERVRIIGHRPGEKLHESLLHEQESVRTIHRGSYYELRPPVEATLCEPFSITSDKAQSFDLDEMRHWIEDAKDV